MPTSSHTLNSGGALKLSLKDIHTRKHRVVSGAVTKNLRRTVRQHTVVAGSSTPEDTRPRKRTKNKESAPPTPLGNLFDVPWDTLASTGGDDSSHGPSPAHESNVRNMVCEHAYSIPFSSNVRNSLNQSSIG